MAMTELKRCIAMFYETYDTLYALRILKQFSLLLDKEVIINDIILGVQQKSARVTLNVSLEAIGNELESNGFKLIDSNTFEIIFSESEFEELVGREE